MTGIIRDESRFDDELIKMIARSVEPHDFDRIAPPPIIWNNILTEVEVETASSEATARRKADRRWFQSSGGLLAIAAATILLAGLVATLVVSSEPDPQELASAAMTDADLPVPTSETAQARVVCTDERCSVDVDLTGLPDAGDADLELWVINGDVSDMYSLGLVTNASGSFELPFGVTAEDYPIVDISIEPRDGKPEHSGQSVLRGVFTEA